MNIKYDYYMRTYSEHIRDSFSGFFRRRLLDKLLEAIDLFNKDKNEDALKILIRLNRKCKTDNERCAVLTFIALCYDEMYYFAPCIDAYRRVLSIDPKRSTIHSNLGLLYRRQGNYGDAIEAFQNAISCDPENPYAHNNLGLTYYRMGEYEKAITCCERALSIKGNIYQAANCLCLCHFVLKRREECKRYYKLAVTNGADPEVTKEELKKLRDGMELEGGDDLWWDL